MAAGADAPNADHERECTDVNKHDAENPAAEIEKAAGEMTGRVFGSRRQRFVIKHLQ
jgi:hypothetical protein